MFFYKTFWQYFFAHQRIIDLRELHKLALVKDVLQLLIMIIQMLEILVYH